MKDLRTRLIHIHRCRGITRRSIRRLLQVDPTLKSIYYYSPTQFSKLLNIPQKNATIFYQDLHNDRIFNQLLLDQNHYSIISLVDENYPFMLKTIKDAPIVLYALGNVSILDKTPSLSVIGTRKPSKEAMAKIEYIVAPLIKDDWIVISGMARGIDSFAHRLTLNYHGETIAVLGGGFQHIYPKENVGLFQQITQKGLVLSEYPPDTSPKPYYFPERNRVISGLSFGTLVIEATEKSGTLITVDQALDQGKEVYAVPGSPLIPQTRGCHQMIRDGAKLVATSQDIIEDWENIGENWKKIKT
ncbi:DNA-protecting protein DprA [Ornithinibacillus sp. L9]|uniref:DNA-protecting protein DprA n=1 Tax=Ornithinibacillus caprae TaxID=2678566 RepID=A0A6N8FP61_9BACI|nr:DNA-processing protein DprA [Ornithinibacillus caprae]MUK89927.1 DNA-protecting protein DprA [Ornithinibacillus caprae]